MLDILIKNGRYADFDVGRLTCGSIGIKDGKIIAVGEVDEPAGKVIDAADKIISTGFVDIHMHEENFARDGAHYDIAERMLRQGISPELVTEATGLSTDELAALADNLQQKP